MQQMQCAQWRSPLPGIYSIIYLKQGGGVFSLAECPEDSYCSSTIIFPHTRPHVSTNLISRFLLSEEVLFFRRTPDGSRQIVYQAGKTIAFCKFTELDQWQHQSCRQCAYKRELNWIDT